jgi:hypothetical protein
MRARDPSAAAAQLLAPDFTLLDAYGLWPNMRAQGRRCLNKDAAVRFMEGLSYSYRVELTMLDVSVAEGSLACFSHWQVRLTPRWQGRTGSTASATDSSDTADAAVSGSTPRASSATAQGAPTMPEAGSSAQPAKQPQHEQADGPLLVDGMAVNLFNAEGQLKVIWMFRGPVTAQDKRLFLEYDKQLAAAEAAQAESDQEAIRAARRAQREQQVCAGLIGGFVHDKEMCG